MGENFVSMDEARAVQLQTRNGIIGGSLWSGCADVNCRYVISIYVPACVVSGMGVRLIAFGLTCGTDGVLAMRVTPRALRILRTGSSPRETTSSWQWRRAR